ncbi:MAG: hypothetical protein DLM67_18760 [Candidatus Nephthysia bennettiae]|uniref:YciI family protein n=1 Tax=Candidatus Nephthysia bennettiae TaxID=3127016 RepID=A0A934NA20_9BACT|nr:YciI family protein [Candidatus Dormibacteraeota bacterium]MBJ7611643.1 YciI family protein [Candidatus Dormibacteraeota bacterium]PZR89720.1 MAG: hypothetical protein DLM67_18760 [Candidatus Dormibacteraeota bacterium]
MRYLALIYTEEPTEPPTETNGRQMMAAYGDYTQMVKDRGAYLGGEALEPSGSATTVRVRDGKVSTTDGPFAETKEQLGGYYLLNCADLDEAIDLAGKIPGARSGAIEVRPILEFS